MIDSVSVKELDWSAESQFLIPAEHLWCDFKCRPLAKNSSPNTYDTFLKKKEGTPKTFPIVSSVFSTPLNRCNGLYGLLGVLGRLRCSTATV